MLAASEYTGLSIALAAFGSAIVVAACGSSAEPAAPASSNGYASFLKLDAGPGFDPQAPATVAVKVTLVKHAERGGV